MSSISGVSVRVTAAASSSPTREGVSGDRTIGTTISARLANATKAWGAEANFRGDDSVLSVNVATGLLSVVTTPVKQVETATVIAASGCTSNGTCAVIVTGAHLTGSPITVNVALTTATHTSAALIAAALRAALAANSVINAAYLPGGTGAVAALTDRPFRDNDATLNIAIPAGLGITAAATSTHTVIGEGGVSIISGGDGKDDEGFALGTATQLLLLVINNTGDGVVQMTQAGGDRINILGGTFMTLAATTGSSIAGEFLAAFTIQNADPTTVEITAYSA